MTRNPQNQGNSDSGLCGCICGVLLTLLVVFVILPAVFMFLMAFLGM